MNPKFINYDSHVLGHINRVLWHIYSHKPDDNSQQIEVAGNTLAVQTFNCNRRNKIT